MTPPDLPDFDDDFELIELTDDPKPRPIKRRIALVLLTGFCVACVVGLGIAFN